MQTVMSSCSFSLWFSVVLLGVSLSQCREMKSYRLARGWCQFLCLGEVFIFSMCLGVASQLLSCLGGWWIWPLLSLTCATWNFSPSIFQRVALWEGVPLFLGDCESGWTLFATPLPYSCQSSGWHFFRVTAAVSLYNCIFLTLLVYICLCGTNCSRVWYIENWRP